MLGARRLGAKVGWMTGDLFFLVVGGFAAWWFWHNDPFLAGMFTYIASVAVISLVFEGLGITRRYRRRARVLPQ